jgi:hypothetical protein
MKEGRDFKRNTSIQAPDVRYFCGIRPVSAQKLNDNRA